jgi:hypothetical protein
VRSGIAQLEHIKDIRVTAADKRAKLRFDPERLTLQDLVRGIRNGGNRFDGRLLLQIAEDTPTPDWQRLKRSLLQVEGVRQVADPDATGTLLVTLDTGKQTRLLHIRDAAKRAGIAIKDPGPAADKEAPSTPSESSVSCFQSGALRPVMEVRKL